MIDALGAVGVVLYGAASLVVGVRLLSLALRTRQLPEWTLGAGFTVGVLAGYVPENLALSTDLFSASEERTLLYVAQVAIRVAAASVLLFTWRVFRPREPWAALLALLLGGALVGSYVVFPLTDSYAVMQAEVWASGVFEWTRSLCLVWGALEAWRYWWKSRRRLRLGLGDPLLTNRFLLWSVAMAASSTIMSSTLVAALVGVDAGRPAWLLGESFFGIVAAVCTWLTFFPTAAYERLVRRATNTASA